MDSSDLITVDADILGGRPVFKGTLLTDSCAGRERMTARPRGWGGIKNVRLLRLGVTSMTRVMPILNPS